MNSDRQFQPAATDVNTLESEVTRAHQAVRVKCALLIEGIRVVKDGLPANSINLTRRHLYDYGFARAEYEIPYEVILTRLPSLNQLPILARVRYNPKSAWELRVVDGRDILSNRETGFEQEVEVPRITDFRGHQVMGRDLSDVVQRLGYDLLGLVPTNYCSYYSADEKCIFCEIVETFDDETPKGTSYRKRESLLLAATEMAAGLDELVTSVTYNGGQLADYDQTVQMYVHLIGAIHASSATRKLDTTIACMPPSTLSLIDELHAAGLNQIFFNVESYDQPSLVKLAPAKSKVGIQKMLEAMKYATRSFGVGRVYTNLVYGIQSFGAGESGTATENQRMLDATRRISNEGIVPTFTVYHTSGRNKTGFIELSGSALYEYTREYGQIVWDSGTIDHARQSILFTIGSLPNTTYNDGWVLPFLESGLPQQA